MASFAPSTGDYQLLKRNFDALQDKYDNIIQEIEKAIEYTESEDWFQPDETHNYIKWSADLIVENESQICDLQDEVARLKHNIADLKRNRQAVSDLERKVESLKRHRSVELQNANSGTELATGTSMKST
jgi:TolA-binding protein